MAISKIEARQLMIGAAEIGAQVLRGILTLGPEGIEIDGMNVTEWLTHYADAELLLIAAPVGKIAVESELKSCYTCGRDYTGETCPYCAEARARLRG